ncbi:MAG: biopolymer transporter ExbB, partial [Pseudomonadota bacterium]
MNRLDREAEPQFAQPVRQIVLMVLVLILVSAGAWLAYPQVAPVFLANPYLNGFIAMVFVIGIFACFWQVFQLVSSVVWIEGFVLERPGHQFTRAPRLLASLAALLRTRGARAQLGTGSARSILDTVATRIDEARDITRYIVNLLIFLGLLGTFYGLATTVPAVVDTIRSLNPSESEGGVEVFSRLMSGLESQLGGMGVAFASSLLGLAGSLVVGILELFAAHGQNRFYRELEEWLSTITRVGFASGDVDGDQAGGGGAAAAVLDHMAEQIDTLTTLYETSETSRGVVDEHL